MQGLALLLTGPSLSLADTAGAETLPSPQVILLVLGRALASVTRRTIIPSAQHDCWYRLDPTDRCADSYVAPAVCLLWSDKDSRPNIQTDEHTEDLGTDFQTQ